MREILFRGQTRRFGEKVKNFAGEPMPSNWVYGGVCCGEGAYSIIYAYMDEEKEIPIEKHVVYTDTIGQYTGLTDKDGKKIFEGDIIGITDYWGNRYTEGVVKYGNFNCSCCDGVFGWYIDGGDIRDLSFAEVIGNIHDNPELLKGATDE